MCSQSRRRYRLGGHRRIQKKRRLRCRNQSVVIGAPILGTLVRRMVRFVTIGSLPVEVVLPISIALSGDRDNIDRISLLFRSDEDPESEARCLFLSSVGTNPSRSSEIKRDERRDPSSSNWKCGVVRYVVCNVNKPRCGMGGKAWMLAGNSERWARESRSSENRMQKSVQTGTAENKK